MTESLTNMNLHESCSGKIQHMETQYAAQENARRLQVVYSLGAETVLKSTYMDDSIDSVEDEVTAGTLQTELHMLVWEQENGSEILNKF